MDQRERKNKSAGLIKGKKGPSRSKRAQSAQQQFTQEDLQAQLAKLREDFAQSQADLKRERERADLAEGKVQDQEGQLQDQKGQLQDQAGQLQDQAVELAKQADKTRKTTFVEFIYACHRFLQPSLRVGATIQFSTKGLTNPKKRLIPNVLKNWDLFPALQTSVLETVGNVLHPSEEHAEHRFFSERLFLEGLGAQLGQQLFRSEDDLRVYQRLAVEGMVRNVINTLCTIPSAQEGLQLGGGIIFENHKNTLDESIEEILGRLSVRQQPKYPPATPPASPGSVHSEEPLLGGKNKPDSYCIYGDLGSGKTRLLLVVEYKPPHKYSIAYLLAGFRAGLNIKKDVVDRRKVPNDPEEKVQYCADYLAASVAAQAFDYMIENGVEYGYITTGEVYVFLHVAKDDHKTLRYHVSIPAHHAIDNNEEDDIVVSQTAVGGVLGMCLLAFRAAGAPHSQKTRLDFRKDGLHRWAPDERKLLAEMTPELRAATPARAALAFKGRLQGKINRSPYETRAKAGKGKSRIRKIMDGDDSWLGYVSHDDHDDDPHEGDGAPGSGTGGQGLGYGKGAQGESSSGGDNGTSSTYRGNGAAGGQNDNEPAPEQSRETSDRELVASEQGVTMEDPFCTQACLLGLMRGTAMDINCPNSALHLSSADGGLHALSGDKVPKMLKAQLADDPGRGCEPMNVHGACGALFKLKLLSPGCGYVFVAKGTTRPLEILLHHEEEVYRRLKKLQGSYVPVCLGLMHLHHRFYYLPRIKIAHMLLMSWGGTMISEKDQSSKAAKTVISKVRRAGVVQMDERFVNMLWNEELGRVLLIDFERAVFVEDIRKLEEKNSRKTSSQDITRNVKSNQKPAEKVVSQPGAIKSEVATTRVLRSTCRRRPLEEVTSNPARKRQRKMLDVSVHG